MLDLMKGARPDEQFHLQNGEPTVKVVDLWFMRVNVWSNIFLPDGSPGRFKSWWVFGNALHWYHGNCKCDGTRTYMYWAGQLDDGKSQPYTPDPKKHVMTTTEKEKLAVRFFVSPGDLSWNNMGGS